ncbi:MAG: hypothetical protein V1660_01795 [archaeon]
METKIGMIAAVSEALRYKKENPAALHEDIIQHISDIAAKERDMSKKIGMIAAASRALTYIDKNPAANEKEIIRHVMSQTSDIESKIDLDAE